MRGGARPPLTPTYKSRFKSKPTNSKCKYVAIFRPCQVRGTQETARQRPVPVPRSGGRLGRSRESRSDYPSQKGYNSATSACRKLRTVESLPLRPLLREEKLLQQMTVLYVREGEG